MDGQKCYIHTLEYYLVMERKNEVMVHATTGTNLGNIMLNEEARHKGHFVIPFIWVI